MAALGDVLAKLRIEDRGWTVLHLRYGVGTKQTLDEIGQSFGVTRERIRQIEEKSRVRLKNGTLVLSDVCNALEWRHDELGLAFASDTTRRSVLRRMNKVVSDISFPGNVSERYRLIVAMRAGQEKYRKTWPNLTYLFCSLPNPIIQHPRVRAAIEEQQEAKRQFSYEELARHVLEDEGAPMHWHDALEAAEHLNRRKTILATPFFNTFGYRKDIFVRVGAGTYGLVKWGLKERRSNVDLIVEYLKGKALTASFGEIVHRVGAPAKMKINSLQMCLDLNPRFYRSIDDEYGLRGWLPAREKQTLRMVRWKIEAPDSYVRVQRAQERGYDVDAISGRDQLADT